MSGPNRACCAWGRVFESPSGCRLGKSRQVLAVITKAARYQLRPHPRLAFLAACCSLFSSFSLFSLLFSSLLFSSLLFSSLLVTSLLHRHASPFPQSSVLHLLSLPTPFPCLSSPSSSSVALFPFPSPSLLPLPIASPCPSPVAHR